MYYGISNVSGGCDQPQQALRSDDIPFCSAERTSSEEYSQTSVFSSRSSETDGSGEEVDILMTELTAHELNGIASGVLPWLNHALVSPSAKSFFSTARQSHRNCDVLLFLCASIHAVVNTVEPGFADEVLSFVCGNVDVNFHKARQLSGGLPRPDDCFLNDLHAAQRDFEEEYRTIKFPSPVPVPESVKRVIEFELELLSSLKG